MSEGLKVFGFILGFAVIYGFMGDDDYHKKFDKPQIIRYNCDMLIGGWHPDVPKEVIEKCRNTQNRQLSVTYYQ